MCFDVIVFVSGIIVLLVDKLRVKILRVVLVLKESKLNKLNKLLLEYKVSWIIFIKIII